MEFQMVVPFLSLILFSFLIIIYYLKTKHAEKIKIIEKGDFAFETNYLENLKLSMLSKGILLTMLAIGCGVAYTITHTISGIDEVPIYLISLLASGGIAMLLFYFIIKDKE